MASLSKAEIQSEARHRLEDVVREIERVKGERKVANKDFKEQIDALEVARDEILQELDGCGVQTEMFGGEGRGV